MISFDEFADEMRNILSKSVGKDYAKCFSGDKNFVLDVKADVEETSAWHDEGFYTDDDIRYALGRVFLKRVGIRTE